MVLGWTCAFLILDPRVLGLKSSFGFWGFGFLCSWSCFIFQFGCFCCLVFTPIPAFVISMKFCLSSLLNLLSLCLFLKFFFCNLIMGCSESRCIVEEWLISIVSYSLLVDNVSLLINLLFCSITSLILILIYRKFPWTDLDFAASGLVFVLIINGEVVGPRLYSCCNCRNHVALHDDVISKAFQVKNFMKFSCSYALLCGHLFSLIAG